MIIVKQPKTKFSIIPNSIIQDEQISAAARMLWVYLASLPDNWQPRHAQLEKALGVGRDKLTAMCRELQDRGLLRRTVNRVDGGKVHGHVWQLLHGDRPPENTCHGSDRPPEKPEDGSSGHIQRTDLTKEKEKTASSPKKKAERRIAKVLPEDWTPSERDIEFAIKEGFEHEQINRIADRFVDYWLGKGGEAGRKVDWSRTWNNWVRTEADKRAAASVGNKSNQSGRDVARDAAARAIARHLR